MPSFCPTGSNRVGVGLGALLLAAMLLVPVEGSDVPAGGGQGLLQRGFSAPDLDVQPALEVHRPDPSARTLLPQGVQLPGVQPLLDDTTPDWEVTWDVRSDRPHLIQGVGYPLLPGQGNRLGRVELALDPVRKIERADVDRLARQFLGRHPNLFRMNPDALQLNPTRSSAAANGRVWFLELQQFHQGIPVEGAHVFFRVNNGNIVQLGSERLAPVQVKMVSRSRREPAFAAVLKRLGILPAQVTRVLDAGTLKIFPTAPPGEKPGDAYRGGRGAGYRHRLAWEFSFKRVNDPGTYLVAADANTGQLLKVVDLTRYSEVKGGIYPRTNTDPEVVVPFPYAIVSNGGTKTTDAAGTYVYDGGTATTSLNGRYAAISDACGPISLSNSADGTLDFGASGGTDCGTPGVGGAGNTHASRTAFFHLTNTNRKAAGFLPGNLWLQGTLAANVNLGQTCNAFWDGLSVNFFASGGGCSNTGELAGLIVHEWGHGMDHNSGGTADDKGSGEAVGDTFAFLETKDSCIGRNFRPGTNCFNCSDCTGVRDVANFGIGGTATIARPSTIADDAGLDCDRYACPYTSGGEPYRGPMGYQGHCESLIASSANWDLTQKLIATYGSTQGWAAMDAIWYDSLVPSKSAYQVVSGGQCNPSAVVNGCGPTNWYTIYLSLDDDDGNLANGTPNGCLIWDAFDAHGIACGTRPACTGGCQPLAVADAGPNRVIAPGGSVEIGTPAQAGTTYSWAPGGETTAQITVSPTVATTYTLTATTECGSLTDTVTVTVQTGSTAVWDAGLKAPACAVAGTYCESGTTVLGRDGKGPEPNQPNTIGATCSDGTSGTFHSDESLDSLRIETTDGSPLAPGKSVVVTAGVWAYSGYSSDRLDLYYAADAAAPTWTLIGTFAPTGAGSRTLTASYVLPNGGPRQAIRGNFRYQGSASPCSTGAYDDRDDLVFAVKTTPDTEQPGTAITVPAAGATVGGSTTVTASASDNVQVTRVEFWLDNALLATDSTSPYSIVWDTTGVANGPHTLVSKAYDAAGNQGASPAVSVTVFNAPQAPAAVYDATLRAPRCTVLGSACDSGPSLLLGRDGRGPEPNQPNTLGASCADGTSGTFHSDESLDALRIETTDGSELAPGKSVVVTATVWAYSTSSSDRLDVYYAADATAPAWTLIATLTPPGAGARTLTTTYTLPTGGSLQAIRGNFRFEGNASPCSSGAYDDRDDLVFPVKDTPDETPPTTAITAPANGAVVGGTTTVTASASDNRAVSRVEFFVDGQLAATDTSAPYSFDWNTTALDSGPHTLQSRAYDAAGHVGSSAIVTVTVDQTAGPVLATYDATLRTPRCTAFGTSCDSGASLLLGRDGRGPEPNQPNTIGATCADGTSGTYHVDESLDRLKVSTVDGSVMAAGKTVRVEATVWAWSSPAEDRLDLYYTANASSPTWTLLATLTPPAGGARTLSATYVLPAGPVQAVRAQFRYQGTVGTCTTGSYNDRDDLIFAVR